MECPITASHCYLSGGRAPMFCFLWNHSVGNEVDSLQRESRSSYELSDPSKRRTSVFLKRGSLSMEPIKKVELDEVYGVYKQVCVTCSINQ